MNRPAKAVFTASCENHRGAPRFSAWHRFAGTISGSHPTLRLLRFVNVRCNSLYSLAAPELCAGNQLVGCLTLCAQVTCGERP